MVTAHGNSLRGIIKYLMHISDEDTVSLNLPTGIPYILELDAQFNVTKGCFLADEETLKKLMEEVCQSNEKEIDQKMVIIVLVIAKKRPL